MAKQKGPLKIQGTVGELSFYKSQDGYLLRQKGGVDGKRIKTDPAFQRTRENSMEFGRAGKTGKLIRLAVRALIKDADNRVVSRLHQQLMKVIKTDTISKRGARNAHNGDLSLLTEFEFNARSPLTANFFTPFTVTIDRTLGTVTLDIQTFTPVDNIAAPRGATHFKISSCTAEIDFINRNFTAVKDESAISAYDNTQLPAISHIHQLTPNNTKHLFLVMRLEFYQEVNGEQYKLMEGIFNSAAIIKVDSL